MAPHKKTPKKPAPCLPHTASFLGTLHLTRTTTVMSDKDFGKCICAGAGNEGLGRVEGHVMNGLIMLLPVGSDLLHARPVVQHP